MVQPANEKLIQRKEFNKKTIEVIEAGKKFYFKKYMLLAINTLSLTYNN